MIHLPVRNLTLPCILRHRRIRSKHITAAALLEVEDVL